MNAIAQRAAAALRAHPHPALRLRELVELIAPQVDRSLTAERLRVILDGYPDDFHILDPASLRWGIGSAPSGPAGAWVVVITDPGDPSGEAPPSQRTPVAMRLRESVRWLGRGIDERSRIEVSRWYAIAMAERAAREAIARRAA